MIDDEAVVRAAKYNRLFETPLIVADLPDAGELTAGLKKVIEGRRESHPSSDRSNKGGWQSDTNMLQWGGAPAQQLGRLMIMVCARFTTDIGQSDPNKPRFEWSGEMWANICPPGAGHESHTHPGTLWAAVFYVDNGLGPGESDDLAGRFVIQDPRNPTPVMYKPDLRTVDDNGKVYRSDHRVIPMAGRLIAFPPWVAHWVTPHQGSGERISIALNALALPARQ